jgi:glycosyltransferase involved in cell wall biosynthesis
LKRIIFINSHPIQYNAPLYKFLTKSNDFDLEVWYCTKFGMSGDYDKQFGINVKWDIPLLDGYKYIFLKNYAINENIYTGTFGVLNFGLFKQILRQNRKTIYVTQGWHPLSMFLTIILGQLFRLKICLRAETPLKYHKSLKFFKRKYKELFLKIIFSRIHKFLYIGEQNRLFYKHLNIPDEKLIFCPYSVNNDFFRMQYNTTISNKFLFRRELGICDKKLCFLSVGKLIEKKRHIDLLKTAKELRHENIAFLIVGEGPERKNLIQYIERHKLDNVKLCGFKNQSELYKFYIAADVFIMPSDQNETWGLVVNEAMNFQLPLLISDKVGCSDDLVKLNGYIYECGNVQHLKEKVQLLLSLSKEELEMMGQESFRLINSYSYKEIHNNLIQL